MTASAASGARLAGSPAGGTIASVVLLAAWLGAAIFFAAVVAPAAFRALPTRGLAGALVGRTLPVLFVAGLVIGLLAAGLALREPAGGPGRTLRSICSVGVALLCAAGQFGIGARIDRLRASLGTTLDALPVGDPARVAFGRLHALSVLALGLAMLLALAVILSSSRHLSAPMIHRD